MSETIAQLSGLLQELESCVIILNNVPSLTDLSGLDRLAGRLADAAATIQKKTGSFRPTREEQAWEASETLRSQATTITASLISDEKLNRPRVFGRNIVTIFAGPKDSALDSDDMKWRKSATRARCDRIRKLSSDGIIAWAVSYKPTMWAAGSMAKDMFDCLIDDIEPASAQSWPAVILETLQKLRNDDSLKNSPEYSNFVDCECVDHARNWKTQKCTGKSNKLEKQ
ncbi:hypothetical protein BBAD15_g2651 [Beauveria bassiana D1-5]|uniref:Uncharacterized protein n=1 Tax=Beauveria bassiana D1-5 TaxID=1245745 RepID=A0A0A2VZM5_BEABA|nr:hypothetical protein BBAD15_g2651 [Beauveria bassiana D1-5]